jgi:PPK2 family polyphosphate:nucleotide phosphotransferase
MFTIDDRIIKRLRVKPGKKISLAKDFSPDYDAGFSKEESQSALRESVTRLGELQDKLYAQNTYSLLVIFQALDAAGKDGTIKHVMSGLNPQGCQVFSFKAPSPEELDHDFLWRAAKALPERGRLGVFNRSYYEEVLVVRVHPEFLERQQLPPHAKTSKIWKNRFKQINNFERYLVENGTVVLKFFLNVSKDEQRQRFLERIAEPEKNWKFSAQDVEERGHWDEYMAAYQECFRETSTDWAPWYVIPANDKAFMRVAVAGVICRTLEKLKLRYPVVPPDKRQSLLDAKAKLEAE